MAVELITKTKGAGRPKQPFEKRKSLSDNPHKNRISDPDLPMGTTLNMDTLPADPPMTLTPYERECWDMIVGTQRAMKQRAWIFRSDCSYILTACGLYGRWREVRDELNALHDQGLGFVDEQGKASPLLNVEANFATKYLASLAALGMVPTRRQISAVEDKGADDTGDGLLK